MLLTVLTIGSLGLGVFYIASMTFLQISAPDALKVTTGGAYYLFLGLGMFAGPPLFTAVAQDQGYLWAMLGYACLLGAGAVALWASLKQKG